MAKSEDLESEDNEDSKKKKTVTKKVAKKSTKKVAKKATKKVAKKATKKVAKKATKKPAKESSIDDSTEISKDEIDDESKDVVSPEIEPDPGPPPPDEVNLLEFQEKSMAELYEIGTSLGLRVGGTKSKHDIVFDVLSHWGKRGTKIIAQGFLEKAKDGYGFLRVPKYSFARHSDDIYIGSNFIKEYDLRQGHFIKVSALSLIHI